MADLGQLKQFQDDYDVSFQWGRKQYKIKFTAAQGLAFRHAVNEVGESGQPFKAEMVWKLAAQLLGGDFDEEAYTFKGGVAEELLEAGCDLEILDRLLTSVYLKMQFSDDMATEFAKTGELGKAVEAIQKKNDSTPSQETPKDAGETTEGDSETTKD